MRRALAVFLCVCMLAMPAYAGFTDIKDPDVAVAAAVLESMGIVTGVSEGVYSPDTILTRAQFCALAVRAMGLEDKQASHGYKTLFTDVRPGAWYTGYINLAYSEGIINGYGNGRFGPDDEINYAQAATLLLRILGYTTDDVGKVWPADFVRFADNLGLSEGVSVTADGAITRAQAAVLLHNTISTESKGESRPYYEAMSGVSSTEKVIILNNNASSGGADGLLMACRVDTASAVIEHYGQKYAVSDTLEGFVGTLLLNSAGRTVGFVPDSTRVTDLIVSSATASQITDSGGSSHRISSGAVVILGDTLYPYSTTGYIQVNAKAGAGVRLYYDDNGAVTYIYMGTGSSAGGAAAVAETNSVLSELTRKLGISGSGYSITKNGAPATAGDLARYDAAYYDAASKTMRVSDYRISGYITSATPSVGAAQTITVVGCELQVLESAWDTLASVRLGDRVTLLLTDDNKVAAAYGSGLSADMKGVLSKDGRSVTLLGSGLVLTPDSVTANANLRGSLVNVSVSSKSGISCNSLSAVSARLNINAKTVGAYALAPALEVYEWAGSGYVYSLSGIWGEGSRDFEQLIWTKTLDSSYVSWYRLNSAGQVDALLLKNATGNCYEYGRVAAYTGQDGIDFGIAGMPAYNSASTLTNSDFPNGSAKHLNSSPKTGYGGLAFTDYNGTYLRAVQVDLTRAGTAAAGAFFLDGGKWYVTAAGYEIPVSDKVQVYIEPIGAWLSGEAGLTTALSSEMTLTIYYDRTPATGARIRIITVTP